MKTERRRWKGGLVGPVLLIALGVLFLLSNLGVTQWNVWEMVLRLWPLVLVAMGLEVLLGGRQALGSMLATVLILGIVALAAAVVSTGTAMGAVSIGQSVLAREEVAQSLDGASRGDVEVGFGIGTLRIGALSDSNNLVEGVVAVSSGEKLSRDFLVKDDTAFYKLRTQGEQSFPFTAFGGRWGDDRVWQLGLNREVPLHLQVHTGVGTSEINLARLQVTDLDLKSGVGKTTLTLPAQGQVEARVDGGIGEVNVLIPEGMAARIRVETGLGDTRVRGDYLLQGGVYVSPGYDTATNRVDLEVNGGIGQITVQGYTSSDNPRAPRPPRQSGNGG